MPAAFTLMLDVFELPEIPDPLHWKVTPLVDELPFKDTVVFVQVMVLSDPASTFGVVLLRIITT